MPKEQLKLIIVPKNNVCNLINTGVTALYSSYSVECCAQTAWVKKKKLDITTDDTWVIVDITSSLPVVSETKERLFELYGGWESQLDRSVGYLKPVKL